jgi:hypothetical protein
LFNPTIGTTIPGIAIGVISVGGFPIVAGTNPNPPPGFNFCHYTTATTMGLNKDHPLPGEPAQVNHFFARDAAVRESACLWETFLDAIGVDATGGCPQPPAAVPIPEPASWALFGSGLAVLLWRARKRWR